MWRARLEYLWHTRRGAAVFSVVIVGLGTFGMVRGCTLPPAPGPQVVAAGRQPLSVPLAASAPQRIRIAALDVDAPIQASGLTPSGVLESPTLGERNLAGWYRGSPTPGERGAAVLLGHKDSDGAAVFYKLVDLAKGDRIEVTRADGSIAVFTVDSVERFAKHQFPKDRVFTGDGSQLRLITCGGRFDRHKRQYLDNDIVFATLVEAYRA